MGSRENALCLFTLGSKTTESTRVATNVNSCLFLEVSQAVIDNSVIEILTTQVSVTVCSFYLKDSIFNS
jgi:hypothetical protein